MEQDQNSWTPDQAALIAINGYYIFLWSTFNTLMVPLLPKYMEERNGSLSGQGAALAAVQVGWFLAFPLVRTAPMPSSRMIYIAVASLLSAAGVIIAIPGALSLIIGRAMEGFGSAILSVLMTGMMAREIPAASFGKAVGARNALGCVGLCTGPILGGYLYPRGGLQLPMSIVFIFILLLVPAIQLLPERFFVAQDEHLGAGRGGETRDKLLVFTQKPEIAALLTVSFASWLLASFSALALPKLMHERFDLPVFATMATWLLWDLLKTVSTLLGGVIADKVTPRQSLLSTLVAQLLFYMLAALTVDFAPGPDSAKPAAGMYSYFAIWAVILALGTTGNGMLGPSFLKDLVSAEETADGNQYEELMLAKDLLTTLAMLTGPMLAVLGLSTLGFQGCLLSFVLICALAVLHLSLITPGTYQGSAGL